VKGRMKKYALPKRIGVILNQLFGALGFKEWRLIKKEEGVQIVRNAARCRKCGDVIESTSVHDFVSCKCGSIFVDGGHEYLRRGGDLNLLEELSEDGENVELVRHPGSYEKPRCEQAPRQIPCGEDNDATGFKY
jgi:hypothetical protein